MRLLFNIYIVWYVIVSTNSFTASLTSFLVLSPTENIYDSYTDLIYESGVKLCAQYPVELEILYNHPELKKSLEAVWLTVEEILDSIKDGLPGDTTKCDAALIPRSQYEIAVTRNSSYCDHSRLKLNDFDLSISYVMYISQFLNSRNLTDIEEWINMYIRNQTYMLCYHNEYYQIFKNDSFNLETYMNRNETNGNRRELKGTTVSVSSGSDFFGTEVSDEWDFCTDSNGDQVSPMIIAEMCTPIIFLLACTLIGMILYCMERRKLKHNRDYNKGKLENHSLKDQTELEVNDICFNAKGMSVSEIIRYLKEQKAKRCHIEIFGFITR